jgi:Flp pilus assembly protein TadB
MIVDSPFGRAPRTGAALFGVTVFDGEKCPDRAVSARPTGPRYSRGGDRPRTRDARLNRLKRTITPNGSRGHIMAHTISLGAALLLVLVAIVLLFLIGPFALLILILVVVLLWYAFGPGNRRITT